VVIGLTGQSAHPDHILHTGLTGGVDRSDRSGLSCCSCPVFKWCLACIRPGGVALVQGELACVQGELFVDFVSMCRAVALAEGVRDVLFLK
jgi:hypothetical protein